MQEALNKVSNWAKECGLTLSPTKTNAVLFTHKRKITNTDLTLKIDGNPIDYVTEVKCLGVNLDHKLNWTAHISEKIKQAHPSPKNEH